MWKFDEFQIHQKGKKFINLRIWTLVTSQPLMSLSLTDLAWVCTSWVLSNYYSNPLVSAVNSLLCDGMLVGMNSHRFRIGYCTAQTAASSCLNKQNTTLQSWRNHLKIHAVTHPTWLSVYVDDLISLLRVSGCGMYIDTHCRLYTLCRRHFIIIL